MFLRSRRARPGPVSVRLPPYARSMLTEPTRIDLLELDIDLRLSDLWREAVDVTEWNLEVVAAFIRAAYGGLLRRADRGVARLALRRARLPDARSARELLRRAAPAWPSATRA